MPIDKTWGILDPSGISISVVFVNVTLFSSTLTTVLITQSLYFFSAMGAHKLISRSTTFLKEFSQRLNQKSKRGQSL